MHQTDRASIGFAQLRGQIVRPGSILHGWLKPKTGWKAEMPRMNQITPVMGLSGADCRAMPK
jgi:hypothetical protein